MSFAEIKRFYPEGKIRYASTLVDDLGKNYDNTRPGVIFDLHFTYLLNKNFALRSLNYIVPYDDTNNDGTTQNYEFNQRFTRASFNFFRCPKFKFWRINCKIF